MHNLVVSSLAVAYLAANTYAIVKVGAFELVSWFSLKWRSDVLR